MSIVRVLHFNSKNVFGQIDKAGSERCGGQLQQPSRCTDIIVACSDTAAVGNYEKSGCVCTIPSIYVCDFTRALKLCYQDIHDSYSNPAIAFRSDAFSIFNSICDLNHSQTKLRWQPDLNNGKEHLVFEAHQGTAAGSHLNATCFNPATNTTGFITRDLWEMVKFVVKEECQCKCS